ncbi:AAA family ATPase [Neorhizobium sp. T786]|uniref:AAA family ATPase n=1 Tax=Pseudorhizobium xiangyangii TaxID=2883104 RepID=UPI001CFFFA36|nr:AAA family ATPase [Neorhizobium xiangyangii]MCB5204157.1 AAA family ATPase [Neorhizobium xiangyangii]
MENFVVISGCSGGGKSTLLDELAQRGHAIVPEPGRRIVAEEMKGDGSALPWVDLGAFAERAVAMALADREAMRNTPGWVFFDRSLVDAAAALEHASGAPALCGLGTVHRYHQRVFLTPPWPEIYRQDEERQHGLETAIAEYDRLLTAYKALGYDVVILPRIAVEDRATFILSQLTL